MHDNAIFDSEEKISLKAVEESSAKVFPIDTVLIALYGQGQTRGRTAILKLPAATNQACAAILPAPEIFDSAYLQFWLRSLYHEMRKVNRAGAQPNWNGRMIKAIRVALPPLSEQQRIVGEQNQLGAALQQLRHMQQTNETHLAHVMPSFLEQAFAGNV